MKKVNKLYSLVALIGMAFVVSCSDAGPGDTPSELCAEGYAWDGAQCAIVKAPCSEALKIVTEKASCTVGEECTEALKITGGSGKYICEMAPQVESSKAVSKKSAAGASTEDPIYVNPSSIGAVLAIAEETPPLVIVDIAPPLFKFTPAMSVSEDCALTVTSEFVSSGKASILVKDTECVEMTTTGEVAVSVEGLQASSGFSPVIVDAPFEGYEDVKLLFNLHNSKLAAAQLLLVFSDNADDSEGSKFYYYKMRVEVNTVDDSDVSAQANHIEPLELDDYITPSIKKVDLSKIKYFWIYVLEEGKWNNSEILFVDGFAIKVKENGEWKKLFNNSCMDNYITVADVLTFSSDDAGICDGKITEKE